MKLFVATRNYSGLYQRPYLVSFAATAASLAIANIDMTFQPRSGDCHVDDGMNNLMRNFLLNHSDCDVFVSIDDDGEWKPEEFMRVVRFAAERDAVVGAGIIRKEPDRAVEKYNCMFDTPEIHTDDDLLVEAAGVGFGLFAVSRSALQKIWDAQPPCMTPYGEMTKRLVYREISAKHGNRIMGGDYVFCKLAREAGVKVFVDPTPTIGHWQMGHVWRGNLLDYWKRTQEKETKDATERGADAFAALKELAEDRAGRDVFSRIARMFGPGDAWPMTTEGLQAVASACGVGTKVVEFGSGVSTLVALAKGAIVTSVEHDPAYAARTKKLAEALGLADNLTIREAPLGEPFQDGRTWYKAVAFPQAEVAIVDGPPRALSDRFVFFTDFGKTFDTIVVDDVNGKVRKWAQDNDYHRQDFGRAAVLTRLAK